MNKIDLEGRAAIVTGGADGIGRAISERFLASGAAVTLWDISQDNLPLDNPKCPLVDRHNRAM